MIRTMRLVLPPRAAAYLVGVAAPVTVVVSLVPARDTPLAPGLAVVLVLPVLVATLMGGWRPGAAAAIIGAASFDVLLTEPYGSLRIDSAEDAFVTAVLLVVGVVVSRLVDQRRSSEQRARARERDLSTLQRYAGIDAGTDNAGWLIRSACEELRALLDAEDVTYVPSPPAPSAIRLAHGKVIVPARSPHHEPGGTATVVLPVGRAGRPIGHFAVRFRPGGPFGVPVRQRAQATAVADLLGAALERVPRPSRN
jgi:K+-sensing histidine kinase KdpD